MKALCICSRGNVRSVNLAYLLKEMCNVQAIAIGYNSVDMDIKHNLMLWATHIFIVDEDVLGKFQRDFSDVNLHKKSIYLPIPLSQSGIDHAFHPEVLGSFRERLMTLGIWPKDGLHRAYQKDSGC